MLLYIVPNFSNAQKVNKQSIYLKNRNHIKGEVIENRPGEFIRIKLDDTVSLQIPYDQIKRVSPTVKERKLISERKGFISVFETGAIIGRIGTMHPITSTYSLHWINGYQFSTHLTTGLGIGYDELFNISSFPLYISLRGDVLKEKFTPVYMFDIGHSFVKNKLDFNPSVGGLYLNPAVGFKNYLGSVAWGISIGYRYQKSSSEYDVWGIRYQETRIYNRMTFKTSIYF